MQILCLREFKNNQPILTCFMFQDWAESTPLRTIDRPSFYVYFNTESVA
jgi:hypothetical protein